MKIFEITNNNNLYYHGSHDPLEVGTILSPDENYEDSGVQHCSATGDVFIESEVQKFADWSKDKLGIKSLPKIVLSYDTEKAQSTPATGQYTMDEDKIWVYVDNRNLIDILRTVFHELVHYRQNELGMINPGDSYPGSPIEAMADMLAGKYIKIYGKKNRQIFQ